MKLNDFIEKLLELAPKEPDNVEVDAEPECYLASTRTIHIEPYAAMEDIEDQLDAAYFDGKEEGYEVGYAAAEYEMNKQ